MHATAEPRRAGPRGLDVVDAAHMNHNHTQNHSQNHPQNHSQTQSHSQNHTRKASRSPRLGRSPGGSPRASRQVHFSDPDPNERPGSHGARQDLSDSTLSDDRPSSSADSRDASASSSSSILPASLSARQQMERVQNLDVVPEDYDLAAPVEEGTGFDQIEGLSDLLFSPLHMQSIFHDPASLLKFTSFLSAHRPQSLPTLIYYLDATKALKAINYANAIATSLETLEEVNLAPVTVPSTNSELQKKADKAFNLLTENDLPYYCAYLFSRVVLANIVIPNQSNPRTNLDNLQGFAEVFCVTDPQRPDNPIIFASPAFHTMTQYNMNYIIGRNCRFLQGPKTHPISPQRLRQSIEINETHWEVFVNYRRDGTPFLNLLMVSPLFDEWGKLRYHIGAQIDVSGSVHRSPELESLQRAIARSDRGETSISDATNDKDEFQSFVEMLDMQELKAIRAWEERLLQNKPVQNGDHSWTTPRRPAMPLRRPPAMGLTKGMQLGLYDKFLLVRPYPSLRILYASPSLSLPGIIQTPIMDKLSVTGRVRFKLTQALEEGREVSSRVGWRASPSHEVESRWIVFTPLVGRKGQIGVWAVILEDHIPESAERRESSIINRVGVPVSNKANAVNGDGGISHNPRVVINEDPNEDPEGAEDLPNELEPPPSRRNGRSAHSSGQYVNGVSHDGSPESRSTSLQGSWHNGANGAPIGIDGIVASTAGLGLGASPAGADEPGVDGYIPLEERLRRKRIQDGVLMGSTSDNPGVPLRRTYKSFSPDSFINTAD